MKCNEKLKLEFDTNSWKSRKYVLSVVYLTALILLSKVKSIDQIIFESYLKKKKRKNFLGASS